MPDSMVGLSECSLTVSAHFQAALCKTLTDTLLTMCTDTLLSVETVIGRGGEQINKIQQESGCKVQIAPGTITSVKLQFYIF